jgi:hypothetical protein
MLPGFLFSGYPGIPIDLLDGIQDKPITYH